MAQKLYPIFADPNAPSYFEGLELTLAGGNLNAAYGGVDMSMNAVGITANEANASWADIIAAANTPPTLQVVLDAGNSANGADASISLLGGVDDAVTSVLTHENLTLVDDTHTSTLSASQHEFLVSATQKATLSDASLIVRNANLVSTFSPSTVSMTNGGNTMSMDPSGRLSTALDMTLAVGNAGGNIGSFVLNSEEFATINAKKDITLDAVSEIFLTASVDALTLAGAGTGSLTFNNTGGASSTMSSAEVKCAIGSASSKITSSNLEVNSGTGAVTSYQAGEVYQSAGGRTLSITPQKFQTSGEAFIDAGGNVRLDAGASSLVFTANSMLSLVAGGATEQYLQVTIDNTIYKIPLFANTA